MTDTEKMKGSAAATTTVTRTGSSTGSSNDVSKPAPLHKSLNSIVEEDTTDDNTSTTSSSNQQPQQSQSQSQHVHNNHHNNNHNNHNRNHNQEAGMGSFDLTKSRSETTLGAVQQAEFKIQQAQHDRETSRLPKPLIPLVEVCLPPDTRLKDVEDRIDEKIEKLQQLFTSCGSGLGCVVEEQDTTFTQKATGIGWTPSSQLGGDDTSASAFGGAGSAAAAAHGEVLDLESNTPLLSATKSSSSSLLQPIRIRTARTRSSRTEEY
eukprot:CAMPEP_0195285030 /NCGR_PEP_ID=MMETSP0707-20130614/3015_1 /TAXON_ID=33640 /ORGANISM="Asterionellopsis glacialis, Strain CCMP134" /LENGTH=263 /DNA_ID=CAMNT_0040344459 /DNA_START=256 /DNA_END=1047 /DNA_ORIENTATION=+